MSACNSCYSSSNSSCLEFSSNNHEEIIQEPLVFQEYFTLGCLAEQNGLIKDAQKYFKKASALAKIEKNRLIAQERLNSLNSVSFPPERSKEIRLINLSFSSHEELNSFLYDNLLVLVFHNCSNVIDKTIILVAERCFQLQKLYLNKCSNLTAIEKGLKEVLMFRKLEYLDISDCPQLKTIRLKAPYLKLFEAYDNKSLKALVLDIPLSVKIFTKGSLNVSEETLEKAFGIENLVRIVKTLDSDFCKFLLKIFYPSMKEIIKNAELQDDEFIPGFKLIRSILNQIDKSEEFLHELELANCFSELKLTKMKKSELEGMPLFFRVTLQKANENKTLNRRDIKALEEHPIQAGIIVLSKALETSSAITKLNLSSCNIRKGIVALAKPFKTNSTITHLDLSDNQIESDACWFLIALRTNTTLIHLILRSNKLRGLAIRVLASALKINSSLKHLDLSENQLGGNVSTICLADAIRFNRSLTYLNLSGNNLRFLETVSLSTGLKANSTLTHLDLSSNKLGFFVMICLLQALENNQTLTHLDLHSNEVKCNAPKRIRILKKLLKDCAIIELDLSENQITEESKAAIKQIETEKEGLKIKLTFSEFFEKVLESLKEEKTDFDS